MPILIIHLPPEHRAAIDEHWIRLTPHTWGWSVEGTLPDDTMHIGPTKCGYAPDLLTAETNAISAAIGAGVGEIYVEG